MKRLVLSLTPAALLAFAPADDAFAALGLNETNVGNLDRASLTDVLLYPVAHGRR